MIQEALKTVSDLKSSKTFWLAVMVIAGTAEEWLRGQLTPHQAVIVAVSALAGIFVRHAIAKLEPDSGKKIQGELLTEADSLLANPQLVDYLKAHGVDPEGLKAAVAAFEKEALGKA